MKHQNLSLAGSPRSAALLLTLVILLQGCSAGVLSSARSQYFKGNLKGAANRLASADDLARRDQLLYYLEKGLILFDLEDYRASTDELLKAGRLMKQQETVSVSEQAASLISNDLVTEYKGEYCERLWVHTFLMMNFLLLGRDDSALVEAKQALAVYAEFPKALEKDYFSRALIALCYENLGEYNDALIEYRKLARLLPPSTLAAGRLTDFSEKTTGAGRGITLQPHPEQNPGKTGSELVIFLSAGRIPVKTAGNILVPPRTRIAFPVYRSLNRRVEGDLGFVNPLHQTRASRISTDLSTVARDSLRERAGRIIAKEAARIAAKEALVQAARENGNELAAALVQGFVFLTEEADTRSWQTLPVTLSLIRLPLPPGRHEIKLSLPGSGSRRNFSSTITLPPINLRPGQRVYRVVRIP